ncbi:restriction endonuclease subunit S [Mycobacterium sp. M23085]|uniref:restriction endonuclease subunit S n=1 Tax=Mycobacterium sp. M23085 TaxID=3378087 RepID=UPI00387801C2
MTWPTVTLDDLKSDEPKAITDGPFGSNLARRHYTASGPRVIRLQNIGDGVFIDQKAHISPEHFERLRAHEVRGGDLLVASLGEVLPRACLAPQWIGPAIVKADCIRVRLGNQVDPRWVLYSLQRPEARRWAAEHRHGVGRPRLGLSVIRQIPVPLPPLPEQHRIVDFLEDHLSRLDAADRGLARTLAKLDTLRERTIVRALTAANVANRTSARLEEAGTADGWLPSLPVGWSWARLGDVADVVGGVTKDAKREGDLTFVEVPYLRVANVQRGRLKLDDIETIRVAPAKASALRLQEGDVLLNEGGDRDKLARGWVWENQIDECIHQNHVFRARVREPRLDPFFLSMTANTIGGSWAERNGKQSVNLASISLSIIRKMPVIVPAAGDAQRIVAVIREKQSEYERLKDAMVEARLRAEALRRSLLAKAFSGRLTGTFGE